MADIDALPVVAYRFRWKAGTGEPVDINPWALCTDRLRPRLQSIRDIEPLVLASALSQAIAQRDQKDQQVAQLQAENRRLREDASKWAEWVEAQRSIEEDLPDGYAVMLQCSPGDWSLSFRDPDGEEINIGDYESTSYFIRQAVAFAKSREALAAGGAQTKGANHG